MITDWTSSTGEQPRFTAVLCPQLIRLPRIYCCWHAVHSIDTSFGLTTRSLANVVICNVARLPTGSVASCGTDISSAVDTLIVVCRMHHDSRQHRFALPLRQAFGSLSRRESKEGKEGEALDC
jgi:hypothetical protein